MCYPRNDHIIVRLVAEGRLSVDGRGRGKVYMRDLRWGMNRGCWREVGQEHKAQQAGKRPAAAKYWRFVVKVDGRCYTLRVNRVVWVALHGPSPYEIDHADDDSLNCGETNLCPLTRLENHQKAMESKYRRENGQWPEPAAASHEIEPF